MARAEDNTQGKRDIARRAMGLIGERDPVAIDAGTTAYEIATALSDRFAGLVVTHSVPVIQLLLSRSDVRVIGLGGELLKASHAFAGSMTVEAARRLRVRTFFLGAAAVDERGIYVETDTERPAKLALMEIADQVVLLADHTKFSTSAPVHLCPVTDVDIIITDARPPKPSMLTIKAAGTRLIVA